MSLKENGVVSWPSGFCIKNSLLCSIFLKFNIVVTLSSWPNIPWDIISRAGWVMNSRPHKSLPKLPQDSELTTGKPFFRSKPIVGIIGVLAKCYDIRDELMGGFHRFLCCTFSKELSTIDLTALFRRFLISSVQPPVLQRNNLFSQHGSRTFIRPPLVPSLPRDAWLRRCQARKVNQYELGLLR